ncbi:hypothetical protein WT00_00310 [Burkholderia territorii]|nr:hypothetical protein WT00_00310 [Burkholderia territorii]
MQTLPQDRDQWFFLGESLFGIWLAVEILAVFVALRIGRRFKRQLSMANRIFSAFGWKNPPNVDLPKASKMLRQPEDPWQMGKLIFRYAES